MLCADFRMPAKALDAARRALLIYEAVGWPKSPGPTQSSTSPLLLAAANAAGLEQAGWDAADRDACERSPERADWLELHDIVNDLSASKGLGSQPSALLPATKK